MNKAILMGNLGQDPELKQTNGGPVLKMSLATSESWRDKNTGEKKQKTEWHTCILWGNRAESLAPHLSKGTKLLVEGQIETRKWTDKNGNDRWSTEINVRNVEFAGGSDSGRGRTQQRQESNARRGWDDEDDRPPING